MFCHPLFPINPEQKTTGLLRHSTKIDNEIQVCSALFSKSFQFSRTLVSLPFKILKASALSCTSAAVKMPDPKSCARSSSCRNISISKRRFSQVMSSAVLSAKIGFDLLLCWLLRYVCSVLLITIAILWFRYFANYILPPWCYNPNDERHLPLLLLLCKVYRSRTSQSRCCALSRKEDIGNIAIIFTFKVPVISLLKITESLDPPVSFFSRKLSRI